MDLYGQDAELRLLCRLVTRLECRTVIDVGAEQGALASGLLDAGVESLHAVEPHPRNIEALRLRFAGDDRVTIHEVAVSDADGSGELHVSSSPDGEALPFGHTLLSRPDASEISWTDRITVPLRSLDSLVASGAIPQRVGILKIDTEGHDLAVVEGMGALEADVVMVEHWSDLPKSLGPCPWNTEEMAQALRHSGFSHFAFIVHRGDFVTLKWDNGDIVPGAMGNLLFVHDRALTALLPEILECAGQLAEEAVLVGGRYMAAAAERLSLIEELEQTVQDRLALARELQDAADERLQALDATTAALLNKTAELEALRRKGLEERAD
jgi:FkbM family methyltransferase